jgi:hypothetical protein
MGPGTDEYKSIVNGIVPVDQDDYISMLHDIDYRGALSVGDVYQADYKAIAAYPNNLHGNIGKFGLIAKNLILNPWDQQYFAGGDELTANNERVMLSKMKISALF